jgi:hypothetical protein
MKKKIFAKNTNKCVKRLYSDQKLAELQVVLMIETQTVLMFSMVVL